MGSFKKSYSKNSGRSIPTVIFDNCGDLELMLIDWLGSEKKPWENIGLLMYKLGVIDDEDSVVHFYGYDRNSNSCSFTVDSVKMYQIKFNNLNIKGFNPEIELRYLNIKDVYECVPTREVELGMIVQKKSHNELLNKVLYTRILSSDNAIYSVDNGKYLFEFGVSKPNDVLIPLFDSMGNYSKYRLDNEEELKKYLLGLKYPISIVDVYKDICELSLLEDVSKYPRLLLKVVEKSFTKGDRVVDLIHLENGKLIDFGMKIGNTDKIIFMDDKGKWSYENNMDDSVVKISSVNSYSDVSYNISVKYNMGLNNIKLLLEDSISDADRNINDTKVLVRKLFKNDEEDGHFIYKD